MTMIDRQRAFMEIERWALGLDRRRGLGRGRMCVVYGSWEMPIKITLGGFTRAVSPARLANYVFGWRAALAGEIRALRREVFALPFATVNEFRAACRDERPYMVIPTAAWRFGPKGQRHLWRPCQLVELIPETRYGLVVFSVPGEWAWYPLDWLRQLPRSEY